MIGSGPSNLKFARCVFSDVSVEKKYSASSTKKGGGGDSSLVGGKIARGLVSVGCETRLEGPAL